MATDERSEITRLFEKDHVRQLATMLRSRKDNAPVDMLDAAYWKKGCSSLGKLRYCVLLGVGDKQLELLELDFSAKHITVGNRRPRAESKSARGLQCIDNVEVIVRLKCRWG